MLLLAKTSPDTESLDRLHFFSLSSLVSHDNAFLDNSHILLLPVCPSSQHCVELHTFTRTKSLGFGKVCNSTQCCGEGQTGSKRMENCQGKHCHENCQRNQGGKTEEVNPRFWRAAVMIIRLCVTPRLPLTRVTLALPALVVRVTPPRLHLWPWCLRRSVSPSFTSVSPSFTSFTRLSFLIYSQPAMRAGNLLLLLQVDDLLLCFNFLQQINDGFSGLAGGVGLWARSLLLDHLPHRLFHRL